MFLRWSRTLTRLSKLTSHHGVDFQNDLYGVSNRNCAKVAAATSVIPADSIDKHFPSNTTVNLNKMFKSKPSSLALPPDSPLRIEDPKHEGILHIMYKMLLYYSKTSKSLRRAGVAYSRISSQVDKPAIYEVFNIEKTFKTTFSLLVLHMWLYLRRLKEEGKEGVEFGQHLYEIYNEDLELRVYEAGVNLLLHRWMKDLEKIFYGNIAAYDAAMLPKAKQNELQDVIWRNVFSDDGTLEPSGAALQAVQAMARYARRESICLSLTEKEALYSGNFMFTPLKNEVKNEVVLESQAEVEEPIKKQAEVQEPIKKQAEVEGPIKKQAEVEGPIRKQAKVEGQVNN